MDSGYAATGLRDYVAKGLRGNVATRLILTLTLTPTLTLTLTLILTPTLTLTLTVILTVTQTQPRGVRIYVATRTVIASKWPGILQLSPSILFFHRSRYLRRLALYDFIIHCPHYLSSHWLGAYS